MKRLPTIIESTILVLLLTALVLLVLIHQGVWPFPVATITGSEALSLLLVLLLGSLTLVTTTKLVAESVIFETPRQHLTHLMVALRLSGYRLLAMPVEAQLCRFCASFWHALLVVPAFAWWAGLSPWGAVVLYLPVIGLTNLLAEHEGHDAKETEPANPSAGDVVDVFENRNA